MTPFASAAAKMSAAIDDVYGELFRYQPMTSGNDVNARSGPDPDRAEMALVAALRDVYARGNSGPVRTQGVKHESLGHASDRPMISFAAAALPYPPRRGDRLVRLGDGRIFQIAEVRRPDGRARIDADVNYV